MMPLFMCYVKCFFAVSIRLLLVSDQLHKFFTVLD